MPSTQSKDDDVCSYELFHHFDCVKQLSPCLGIVATCFLLHTSPARRLTGQGRAVGLCTCCVIRCILLLPVCMLFKNSGQVSLQSICFHSEFHLLIHQTNHQTES